MVVIKLKDREMYLESYECNQDNTWVFAFCTSKGDAEPFDGMREASQFMIDKGMDPNLYKIVPKEGSEE